MARRCTRANCCGCHSGSWGLGQPFWIVGLAGIALGALTVARVPDAEFAHSPPEGDSRDDSRLRMIPATGAGMLVFLALVGQLLTDRAPAGELFVGTLGLSVLLVIRLMFTLGENGWLLRRLETSGHAEERLRDLGLALNLQASLEMERVRELVCRQGRAALRADNVVIWLVDSEAGEIRVVESAGVRRDILRDRRICDPRPDVAGGAGDPDASARRSCSTRRRRGGAIRC